MITSRWILASKEAMLELNITFPAHVQTQTWTVCELPGVFSSSHMGYLTPVKSSFRAELFQCPVSLSCLFFCLYFKSWIISNRNYHINICWNVNCTVKYIILPYKYESYHISTIQFWQPPLLCRELKTFFLFFYSVGQVCKEVFKVYTISCEIFKNAVSLWRLTFYFTCIHYFYCTIIVWKSVVSRLK